MAEARLADQYEVVLNQEDTPLDSDALRSAMSEFDVLCPTVSDRIPADIINAPRRRVGLIANYGAGLDHIDLNAARASGLPVTNTPDVLTDATAELAVLLMMMVSRRASEGEKQVREGVWDGWRPTHLVGQTLSGKRLGLVGFGRIGQATARLAASAFGMRIAYHAPRRSDASIEAALSAEYYPSYRALAANADVLSLHCRAGTETHHLIDAQFLATMKRSAILINTARGSIVDEVALAYALVEGIIAGAGLDVYENEPAVNVDLLSAPNTVLLPHLGSATVEARSEMGFRVAANIMAFTRGEALPDRAT